MNTVKDLLAAKGSTVYTIAPGASVYEALALMADKGIGALVVVSGERLKGIISERDYARKVILQGKFSKNTPVREIMSAAVTTVKLTHTIDECMVLMTDQRLRHLPVLDDGKLVGIISIGDLVKSIMDEQQFTIKNLENYISGSPEVK
ncbi:MAG: CBS domain-containing protein [bacterium]